MNEVFLGTVQGFAFNFVPQGWLACNGQLLPIAQYSALFSLLGTQFGGNGQTTFGLPDLQGRTAIGQGNGAGLPPAVIGQAAGSPSVTLTAANLPAHAHTLSGNAKIGAYVGNGDNPSPVGNVLAASPMGLLYNENAPSQGAFLGNCISGSTDNAGSNVPVNVQNSYLVINYCICYQGIFPSRS